MSTPSSSDNISPSSSVSETPSPIPETPSSSVSETPSPIPETPSPVPETPSPSSESSVVPESPSPSETPSPSSESSVVHESPSPSETPSPSSESSIVPVSPSSVVPSPSRISPAGPVALSPSVYSPSPSIVFDDGSLIPLISGCLFILLLVLATVFRKRTRKMWDTYNVNRYRTVEGNYRDLKLPSGLPQIDVFDKQPIEAKTIELPTAPFKDTPV